MRYKEILEKNQILTESLHEIDLLTQLAQESTSVEEFIKKTASGTKFGMDVLYRGHNNDKTGDNAFMTDWHDHAAEYSGDEGTIDAFAYNPNDVLFFNNNVFNEMRSAYRSLSDQELADIYKVPFAEYRFTNAMMNGGIKSNRSALTTVKKILRSNKPYSEISDDPNLNDLLIPLLQKYADSRGKNIIAFHGGDYGDWGGQTEYVVSSISKLTSLRELYMKLKHQV